MLSVWPCGTGIVPRIKPRSGSLLVSAVSCSESVQRTNLPTTFAPLPSSAFAASTSGIAANPCSSASTQPDDSRTLMRDASMTAFVPSTFDSNASANGAPMRNSTILPASTWNGLLSPP